MHKGHCKKGVARRSRVKKKLRRLGESWPLDPRGRCRGTGCVCFNSMVVFPEQSAAFASFTSFRAAGDSLRRLPLPPPLFFSFLRKKDSSRRLLLTGIFSLNHRRRHHERERGILCTPLYSTLSRCPFFSSFLLLPQERPVYNVSTQREV